MLGTFCTMARCMMASPACMKRRRVRLIPVSRACWLRSAAWSRWREIHTIPAAGQCRRGLNASRVVYESYYLPHPSGGYVQFENLVDATLQDGKLVRSAQSFYRVADLPAFAQQSVLNEATRQLEAASANGLQVQWLVSDEQAVTQLQTLFENNSVNITVTHLPRISP
jgi:hypothetical protein